MLCVIGILGMLVEININVLFQEVKDNVSYSWVSIPNDQVPLIFFVNLLAIDFCVYQKNKYT